MPMVGDISTERPQVPFYDFCSECSILLWSSDANGRWRDVAYQRVYFTLLLDVFYSFLSLNKIAYVPILNIHVKLFVT